VGGEPGCSLPPGTATGGTGQEGLALAYPLFAAPPTHLAEHRVVLGVVNHVIGHVAYQPPRKRCMVRVKRKGEEHCPKERVEAPREDDAEGWGMTRR